MKKTKAIILAAITFIVAGTGCVKSLQSGNTLSNNTAKASTSPDRIVLTPFGPRHASDVIHIESGYHLRWDGDHLKKVDRSGNVVLDLGKQEPLPYLERSGRGVRLIGEGGDETLNRVPLGSGWITFGSLPQMSPVTYFATTWIVPTAPPGNDNQTLYLFNGLEDGSSHILQPVLQYGLGPDNGPNDPANQWYVDNWYASCASCGALHGDVIQVNPGTTLTGIMQQTGQSGSLYSYSSSFSGAQYDNATMPVENVPALTYPFETMEAYGMQNANDYPADDYVRMSNINILNSSGRPATFWSVNNVVTDIGQQTIIVSNNNPGGDVDLYFHPVPAITGGGTFLYTNSSPTGSGTVTGPAGRYVSATLWATGHPGQTFSLSVSLTGSSFVSSNSAFETVTNGSLTDGFYLPASGTVSWNASYSGTVNGYPGKLMLQ